MLTISYLAWIYCTVPHDGLPPLALGPKMSASIYWRLITKDPASIAVGASSAFVSAMQRAFGPSPWRLNAEHLSTLHGMAATETDRLNGYRQIIEAIQNDDATFNTIEVWPEY